jgi:hypothetical protein
MGGGVQFDDEGVGDLGEDRLFALDVLGLLEADDLLLAEDLQAEVLPRRLLLTQPHLPKRTRAWGGILKTKQNKTKQNKKNQSVWFLPNYFPVLLKMF